MSEQSIAQARASVMLFNKERREWEHSGGSSGISRVHLYYHPINKTYRIVGRKVQDHTVTLNSALVKGLKYNEATPTFYQWRNQRDVHGLSFPSKEDAQVFGQAVSAALEHLRNGKQKSHTSQRQLQDEEEHVGHSEQQLRQKEKVTHATRLSREADEQAIRAVQELTNVQGQLREKERETANLRQQVASLEGQLRAKDQQVSELQGQLRAKDQHVNELQTTLTTAQQTLRECQHQEPSDWAVPRDDIQLTDRLLGRGGWGSVVEGKYCGCAVAVKQIHELILSPHNRNLFEREMDIASRCCHPCLLQFIGATNDEGNPLFVTELMETSLRAMLEQRPLSATEVSNVSLDVARALSYLHRKKPSPIIHRDISSANVLLWRQGEQWRGKVSDYGTANFMQQTMTVAPGAMIYMAPEALTSNQTVKVDVYSFGVLLCEMCIRELPNPQRRDQQIAMVTEHVLRALIRRCVQTEPASRPSMEEIIEEHEEPVQSNVSVF